MNINVTWKLEPSTVNVELGCGDTLKLARGTLEVIRNTMTEAQLPTFDALTVVQLMDYIRQMEVAYEAKIQERNIALAYSNRVSEEFEGTDHGED